MDTGLLDGLIQAHIVEDPAPHVLVQKPGGDAQAVRGAAFRGQRLLANHGVIDVLDEVVPMKGFNDVGVHVKDDIVLKVPFLGLLLGVRQDLARVRDGLHDLDRHVQDLVCSGIH